MITEEQLYTWDTDADEEVDVDLFACAAAAVLLWSALEATLP